MNNDMLYLNLRRYFKILILFVFVLFCDRLLSQDKVADSLKLALKTVKDDTTRCYLLNMLVQAASENEWEMYNEEMLKFSEGKLISKANNTNSLINRTFKKYLASAYNNKGYAHQDRSETNKALEYFEKALKIRKEINDLKGIAQTVNNIGAIFHGHGNIPKAIEYYQQSLIAREKMGDLSGLAVTLTNLGTIYQSQEDLDMALEYYKNSLAIGRKLNDARSIALALNGLGTVYRRQYNFDKAMQCYTESFELYKKIGNIHGMSSTLNNMGVICDNQNQFTKSLDYYQKSLKLREEANDKTGISICLVNIGRANGKLKKYNEGINNLMKALEIGKAQKHAESIKSSAQELYILYKDKQDAKNAIVYLELFVTMRDSVNNESTRKASIKSQLKYEYEKQAAADSVAHAKESEIKNAEIAKQTAEIKAKKNQQYALFGGLGLVMIFAGFMYNRFKVTQKQKGIIEEQKTVVEEQKKLVEEKQKEILDSIQYARRIQMAQIPSDKRIEQSLKRIRKK